MDWKNTGYEIIDAHIHPVSDIPGTDTTLFGVKTPAPQFVEILKAAGISGAAGSVFRRIPKEGMKWADFHELNLAALKFRDQFPGFYYPGICVHPAFPKESLAEVEELYAHHNVRFIGELVAYQMNYSDYAVPELDPIWEFAQAHGMMVNLHLNSIEEPEKILKNFPELKLVIAHPTASPAEFDERMKIVARYPNAALDISGSGPNSWGVLHRGIKIAGKEKLLFGTDFPIRNPGMYVAGVLFEKLSDDENAAIFSGNFKRLYGLK